MRISPVVAPTVPITAWDEIVIAPSEIAVQFVPSPPSARLKSSEAMTAAEAGRGNPINGTMRRLAISTSPSGHRNLGLVRLTSSIDTFHSPTPAHSFAYAPL